MPLPVVDWAKARAEYEAGDSYAMLGARWGRSKAAFSKRGRAEGWVQDAEPAIRRQVAERVALGGKVTTGDPDQREQAIEKAVDVRVGVVKRHQEEWNVIRGMVYAGLKELRSKDASVRAAGGAVLKDVRQAAQALSLAQSGERRAYNISDKTSQNPDDNIVEFVWVDGADD
jgi:hypothetical protein